MATFDRFDICEAYAALEADYNAGGWLQERPSNQRRKEACSVQLDRIGFKPGAGWRGYDSLSDNGKEIYEGAVERLGLPWHPSAGTPAQEELREVLASGLFESAEEPYFTWRGCEVNLVRGCRPVGNDVYDVKGYRSLDDARGGEDNLIEFRCCGECLNYAVNGEK